jgi:hypothetical protein
MNRMYAEFFLNYFPGCCGLCNSGGAEVVEHPFGHPEMPGVKNHDRPHFEAVKSTWESKDFFL